MSTYLLSQAIPEVTGNRKKPLGLTGLWRVLLKKIIGLLMRKEFWRWMVLLRIVIPIIAIAQPGGAQPGQPINVNAVPGVQMATVSWEPTGSATSLQNFDLYYSEGEEKLDEGSLASYKKIGDITDWTQVVSSLEANQAYSFAVQAKLLLGGNLTLSPLSETVTATPLPPPNIPPTVSLTSPTAGQSFLAPANIALSANASDADGSVTKVEFFNGVTKIGEALAAPYNFAWNSVAPGAYSLTAKATDNQGATTTSAAVAITVTEPIPNQPPTVSLTSPTAGQSFLAPANISLSANANDADGSVTKVEFFNGATKIGEDLDAPYNFAWNSVAPGAYSLTAKATDNQGATTTSAAVAITVNAPNQPPTVSLTSPTAGQSFLAPANIALSANASDADGSVTKVEFFNGATKIGEDLDAPYNFAWNNVAAGAYSLTAKATDNQGAITTSAAVAITVNAPNQPPSVSLTSPTQGQAFLAPANISLTANASDVDGSVTKVEFFNGATKIGEKVGAPFSFGWNDVPAGAYSFTAKATDNQGATTTSTAVAITVTDPVIPPPAQPTATPIGGSYNNPQSVTLTTLTSGATIRYTLNGNDPTVSTGILYANPISISATTTLKAIAVKDGVASSILTQVYTINNPPTVTLTSPANGTIYRAPASITATATASDPDGPIAKVEFYFNNELKQTATASPYTYTLSDAAAGGYTIYAKAFDAQGHSATSASVTIIVNQPPTIFWVSPANNSTFTTADKISLSANASDVDGTIAKVSFFRGNIKVADVLQPASGSTYTYLWSLPPVGSHALRAVAYDNRGDSTLTLVRNITVNDSTNKAPTVSITKPANEAKFVAGAQITLESTASDPDGSIARVQYFYAGNTSIGQSIVGPAYPVTWNSVPAGTYALTARATDNGGGSGNSSIISISVTLPAPSGVKAAPGNNSATISWNAVAGATNYNLHYNAGVNVNSSAITFSNIQGTSYTVSGLTNGQQYAFAVSTEGPGGTSPRSAKVNATPNPQSPPAPPANLTATAQDATISLSWTASSGATKYTVYYAQGNTVTTTNSIKLQNITVTSSVIDGLTNGTNYTFAVTAHNVAGESDLSNSRTIAPVGNPPVLGDITPTQGTKFVGQNHQISVTTTGGTPPFTYRWTLNGTTIPGATSNVLSIQNAQLDDAGKYAVVVSNPYGNATKSSTLNVNQRKVALARATPEARSYTEPLTISVSTNTPSTVIHYTLDNSVPSPQSPKYDPAAKIILSGQTVVLKTRAFQTDYLDSDIFSATYTYVPPGQALAPRAEPVDSVFTGSLNVTLISETEGADIHYTLDGSVPTAASAKYSAPIEINRDTRIKAIAVKAGLLSSTVMEKSYTRFIPTVRALKPIADPTGLEFSDSILVRLTTQTSGAEILYALNDSTAQSANWPVYNPATGLTLKRSTQLRALARRVDLLLSDTLIEVYTQLPTTPTSLQPGDSIFAGTVEVDLLTSPVGASIHYTLDGSNPLTAERQPAPNSLLYNTEEPILINSSRILKAVSFLNGKASRGVLTNFYLKEGEPLPSPAANPSATSFGDTLRVLLRSAYESRIYYTLDGSIPTTASTEYTGAPVKISESVILQAIAVKSGFPNSKIMVERYTFIPPTPTATPAGGNFVDRVTVQLSGHAPGVEIRYTTDGRSPLAGNALVYNSAEGITLTTTSTLMAYTASGGQASEVLTENYYITGASDTLLLAGETMSLPGGYSLASPINSQSDVSVQLVGGESVSVAGFSDRRFGMQIAVTDPSMSFPHLHFSGPPGSNHALYRRQSDGRVQFISSSDSGLITEAGLYVLAIDIVPPQIVVLDKSFDANDSTRIRIQILDNVSNLSYSIKRNDDTVTLVENLPISSQDILEFMLKHPTGVFKPLLAQVIVTDHHNQQFFPPNPTARYGVPQKLRNVKSPSVFRIAQPQAASDWDLIGFPFKANPAITTSQLQESHSGTRFSASDWNAKLGPHEGMKPGKGFWLNSSKAVNILQFPQLETADFVTDSITVKLSPGWNTISSPYLETLYWPHSREFPDQYGPSLIKGLNHWNPQTASYTYPDSLEPWRGYFVYSYATADTTVRLLARPPDKPILLKKESAANRVELRVQLEQETPIWLGAAPFADDGLGIEDEFSLPKRSGATSAWAVRGSTALQTDMVHFAPGELLRWRIVLAGKATGDSLPAIRITKAILPGGYEAWAFSRSRNMKFPLPDGATVSLSGLSRDTLEILAGPAAKMAGIADFRNLTRLEKLNLSAIPMDGDFQVSLQIPGLSRIRLSVWNLQGQRLGELNPGRLAEGRYRFTFSQDFGHKGRNRLSSGMYFLLAEIRDDKESHRLVKRLPIR